MLKSLLVKDYALIEKIFVEFEKGLNIITGETGAGKSILIDAMGLLLGERAASEVIRRDADKTVVEGIFEIEGNKKVKSILNENEIESQSELILRREISRKGSNRCFINDTPVSLSVIKGIGNMLVDLHGQHEHQSLLRSETHIEVLDEFGNCESELAEYTEKRRTLLKLKNELTELKSKEQILKEKKDFYEYQIKEIDEVSPEEDEDEKLINELRILENSERLLELSNGIYEELFDSNEAVYSRLVKLNNDLNELKRIDTTVVEVQEELQNAVALIKDVSEFIRSYKEKIDLDPESLENKRERLGTLNLLKKKYGGNLKAVIDHRNKIGEEFLMVENFSDKLKSYEKEIAEVRNECGKIALMLSERRKSSAKKIEKEAEQVLNQLGISEAKFKIDISQRKNPETDNYISVGDKPFHFNERGIDEVEFFISTNKGEAPKPLVKVASGGEISRVMLALKTILAKNDRLPLLIFDEIDTGISGRIAQKVGQNLKSLAAYHQIISITHLPQIAALANNHFAIEKKTVAGRVISSLRKLSEDEKVTEVAKLLSGENVTSASLNSAKELMKH